MSTVTTRALALALVLAATTGCSPAALQALTAAANAANSASPAPGNKPGDTASTTGGTSTSGSASTTTTGTTTTGTGTTGSTATGTVTTGATTGSTTTTSQGAGNADTMKVVDAFKAKIAEASQDPEKMARLFMAAFAYYPKDKKLAIGLMMLCATDGERQADGGSPTGFTSPPARAVYWPGVDRQPTLPSLYFDKAENAIAADAEAHVVIDTEYKAVDKGVQGDLATFYMAQSGDANKRPRPLKLEKKPEGWRVSNYSSVVVPI